MNTAFRQSFETDLAAITDASLLRRVRKVIEHVEAARTFQQIPNLKRLESTGKYYRIRVGDYRIGFDCNFRALPGPQGFYRYFP